MAFEVKKPFNKDAHFAALKAAAQQTKSDEAKPLSDSKELARAKELPKPEDCSERIRIVFDDSGSMSGEKMDNAKAGVVEFLRNCIPGATAVAIHLLNSTDEDDNGWSDKRLLPPVIANSTLSSDLILVASAADCKELRATGGTPLEPKLLEALQATPRASRIVAFSDGQPDSKSRTQQIINLSKEYQIPIDTVYLDSANPDSLWGYNDSSAMSYMKELAEATGGIFLHFKKGSSFKTSFKYLAPVKRLMLMDSAFKAKVERGEV